MDTGLDMELCGTLQILIYFAVHIQAHVAFNQLVVEHRTLYSPPSNYIASPVYFLTLVRYQISLHYIIS